MGSEEAIRPKEALSDLPDSDDWGVLYAWAKEQKTAHLVYLVAKHHVQANKAIMCLVSKLEANGLPEDKRYVTTLAIRLQHTVAGFAEKMKHLLG